MCPLLRLDDGRHMTFRVGFTGTRHGMSLHQRQALDAILLAFRMARPDIHLYLHHGKCLGADYSANKIAYMNGLTRVAHPSDNPAWTFEDAVDEERPAKPPLARNKDIVYECDVLIVAPLTDVEEVRSGTWSTKRYAEKIGKPYIILERESEVTGTRP